MLNSTSVKLLGAHSKMLMASVYKTDTGDVFLHLIGETDGYRYEIHKGDNYWLDEATQQKLKNSDVVNIGVSAHDKLLNFSYTVGPKKKALIKKMLLLFDKDR